MKTPILGSSYELRSPNVAASRMVNLFPEAVPEGGKEPAYLQRTPGLRKVATIGVGPVRGMRVVGDVLYVASDGHFYSVSRTWSVTEIGAITGKGPVSMADNGNQIFIACNGTSYIYDVKAGSFNQITDPDFPGASTVGFLDGYFVFVEPDSQRFWVTQLYDGFNVDGLDFASAEGSPDNLVGHLIDHREAWLFGTKSVEVWYNAGDGDFPLQRLQGAFIETGCAARYSPVRCDNSVMWLGSDERGVGMVYRADGYTAKRISTHAIEWQIQQYPRIDDAIGFAYQQDGHSFYVLSFPTASATWVYDAATGAWHERADFQNGQFKRHRANCHASFNGFSTTGDYENGNLYVYDKSQFSDNGSPLKWLRSWRALPTGGNDLNRSIHHGLQLDCQTGVGVDGVQQGSNPVVVLRWSDDGGHTWSNEHPREMGKLGEFSTRVVWRRLGMTMKLRDRVYEVSGTDPVDVVILGAELDVNKTGM